MAEIRVQFIAPGDDNGGPGSLVFSSEEQYWTTTIIMHNPQSEMWANLMACLEEDEGGEMYVDFGNTTVSVEAGYTTVNMPNAWVSAPNKDCVEAFRAMRAYAAE